MLAGMSRAQLKGQARARLLGNYGNAAGALVIMELISIIFVMVLTFGTGFAEALLFGLGDPGVMVPALVAAAVLVIAGWILYFGAVQILMAGYTRLIYRSVTEGESNLNDLTYALNRRMFRFIGLTLIMLLVSIPVSIVFMILAVLLSLLFSSHPVILVFCFWGFFLFYMVMLVPIVCLYWMLLIALAEDPSRTMKEAWRIVRGILKGNLWRMVKFELSFFGMYALGYLSFGLGYLWVMPYSLAANILFYQQLKEECFQVPQPVSEEPEVWYPMEQDAEYPKQQDTL